MKMFPLLAVAGLLVPAVSPAADISYSYGDLVYQMLDSEADDGDGFALRGSYEVTGNIYVLGGYQDGDFDAGASYTNYRLGGGYHAPINDTADWYGQLTWENYEVETPFLGSTITFEDDGFGLEGGARVMLTSDFELNGHVKYLDVGEDSDTLVGVGGLFHATEQFAVGAEYEDGDTSAFSLFARWHF